MMIDALMTRDLSGQTVLDNGCGTGVLGILAKMRGASYVEGVDIDEWAFNNARENAASNGVEIVLKLGDATSLKGNFDIIIANTVIKNFFILLASLLYCCS